MRTKTETESDYLPRMSEKFSFKSVMCGKHELIIHVRLNTCEITLVRGHVYCDVVGFYCCSCLVLYFLYDVLWLLTCYPWWHILLLSSCVCCPWVEGIIYESMCGKHGRVVHVGLDICWMILVYVYCAVVCFYSISLVLNFLFNAVQLLSLVAFIPFLNDSL